MGWKINYPIRDKGKKCLSYIKLRPALVPSQPPIHSTFSSL